MSTTKEIELEEALKALLGNDVVVTPQSMATALAFTIKELKDIQEQRGKQEFLIAQTYATPAQLSRYFGVEKTTMWRQLRKFEESGDILPFRFESKDGGEGYPRYRISELEGLLQNRQMKGDVQ